MKGNKGDFLNETTGDHLVNFFSKAGNIRRKEIGLNPYFYSNTVDYQELYKKAWDCDEYMSMQLLMWMRDCRGGAGSRGEFRNILKWLAENHTEWVNVNIHFVPEVGRWDDLLCLIDTECEKTALEFWAKNILDKNALANKWVPREKSNKLYFHKIRHFVGDQLNAKISPQDFRKHLSKHSKVIESQMCDNQWESINYNHVPSVAMSRYHKTFKRRDGRRFEKWIEDLKSGKSKINAEVLFPHDCIRTLRMDGNFKDVSASIGKNYVDSLLANAQFAALPNYMEENNMRIMPICDFSGSMSTEIEKGISCLDVSMGLGLYCSDRVGESNPFYRKFIPFSDDAHLVDWENDTFSVAAQKYCDGYMGLSTQISKALDKILEAGLITNASNDQMPNCLLIISDMQFDAVHDSGENNAVKASLAKWEEKGFNIPVIIYWDLTSYDGYSAQFNEENVSTVSGYSPSILKSICEGEMVTPFEIMKQTISKYEIVRPY